MILAWTLVLGIWKLSMGFSEDYKYASRSWLNCDSNPSFQTDNVWEERTHWFSSSLCYRSFSVVQKVTTHWNTMKILVFFCLLSLVLADDDWWNPTKKYGKWAKMQVKWLALFQANMGAHFQFSHIFFIRPWRFATERRPWNSGTSSTRKLWKSEDYMKN